MGSTDEALASWADEVRNAEARAQAVREAHLEAWGDGPPYFSTATVEFWRALAAGTFTIARCGACADVHFPPRVVCPNCWATDRDELQATPGDGSIVSFTELFVVATSLRELAPLLIVCVDLDEGVRVLTWYLGDRPASELTVGERVRIEVQTVLGQPRFVAVSPR